MVATRSFIIWKRMEHSVWETRVFFQEELRLIHMYTRPFGIQSETSHMAGLTLMTDKLFLQLEHIQNGANFRPPHLVTKMSCNL